MAQQPPAPPPPPPPEPPPGGPVYSGRPAYAARPGGLTASAVLLLVVGGLRAVLALIGLIAIAGAGDQLAGIPGAGAAIGVAVVIVLIVVAAGVLQILGGVQILRLRRRGRPFGLTGTIIGLVVGLLGLVGSLADGAGASAIFTILFLIADIVIIVLLVQNGRYLTNP
ncbi:MAG TPA: hypothetical protein VE737_10850 [Actinomycetota bacterium]|nr:hypothetical protein [Actinomycetota bacterium]